jgi:hypothetical protein
LTREIGVVKGIGGNDKKWRGAGFFLLPLVGVLLLAVLMGTCEQAAGAGPGAGPGAEQTKDPEWWEEWEEPEEEELPPAVLTGISVAKKPDITLYALGQDFAGWEGLTVLWEWSDGSHEEIPEGEYTLLPDTVDTGADGSLDIEVRAGGFTAWFDLYVSRSSSVLQSIRVKTPPAEFSYLGEPFNTTGMVVEGIYNDRIADLPSGAVSVEGYDGYRRVDQTVTLRVNDRAAILVARPRVKPDAIFSANYYGSGPRSQRDDVKPAYIKGKKFDLADSNLMAKFRHATNGFDLTLAPGNGLYPEDVKGYDQDKAGKQEITLDLDGATAAFTVYVLDVKPDVWFDYGFVRHEGDPEGAGAGFGKYYVEQGKPLVLAPVRYLIGYNDDHTPATDTTYSWTVTGGSYDTAQAHNGEFFTFTPADAGIYTVRVEVAGRNYINGLPITKTAATEVISFSGKVEETKQWGTGGGKSRELRNFAPGQFTESGNGYGWSLGSIGGYWMWLVEHRDKYFIGGNAFGLGEGGWVEPGIVWVMEDQNKNGVPDEMWHELKGPSDVYDSATARHITRRYANTWVRMGTGTVNGYGQTISNICWVDCKGRSGLIGGGWPKDWGVAGDWATYTGTLIGDDGNIANGAYNKRGVVRQYPIYNYQGKDRSLTYVDALGAAFYLEDAMDARGDPVALTNVRFVKVQTAEFVYGGVFGELSTEITNADFLGKTTDFHD